MGPISDNDVESELSHAFLHAVAARARMSYSTAGRLEDSAGVDAVLTAWAPFEFGQAPDGFEETCLQEVTIHVQLKATTKKLAEDEESVSYPLAGIPRYNDLREERLTVPRILVVLLLPRKPEAWLKVTPKQLVLQGRAYWQSLRGAHSSENSSSQTVKLPKSQMLTPANLANLAARIARNDIPRYPE